MITEMVNKKKKALDELKKSLDQLQNSLFKELDLNDIGEVSNIESMTKMNFVILKRVTLGNEKLIDQLDKGIM